MNSNPSEKFNAFETFAELHPHEAYELDSKAFCDYVRKSRDVNIADNAIIKLLLETDKEEQQ